VGKQPTYTTVDFTLSNSSNPAGVVKNDSGMYTKVLLLLLLLPPLPLLPLLPLLPPLLPLLPLLLLLPLPPLLLLLLLLTSTKFTSGIGGVSDLWSPDVNTKGEPEGSYWCGSASSGGWAGVDKACVTGTTPSSPTPGKAQLQLPVGLSWTKGAQDLNRFEKWGNPTAQTRDAEHVFDRHDSGQ